jgi:hypothetical protein
VWRLSVLVRLIGLALYAVALAVAWTVWGLLILCGMMLVAGFRLVGVSLVGLEHAVATHRPRWQSALRALTRRGARQPPPRG